MAYTRKYFLNRVKKVSETYVEYKNRGATNEWIYEHVIRPQFNISRTTMYEYLTIPYATRLKEIEAAEQAQQSLFGCSGKEEIADSESF